MSLVMAIPYPVSGVVTKKYIPRTNIKMVSNTIYYLRLKVIIEKWKSVVVFISVIVRHLVSLS